MNLEIKQVIQLARAQLNELLPDLGIATSDVRLEEIEREGENWTVTFSVPDERNEVSALRGFPRIAVGRSAKVVVINAADGKFVALRQRVA
jgi:hypothetical protein